MNRLHGVWRSLAFLGATIVFWAIAGVIYYLGAVSRGVDYGSGSHTYMAWSTLLMLLLAAGYIIFGVGLGIWSKNMLRVGEDNRYEFNARDFVLITLVTLLLNSILYDYIWRQSTIVVSRDQEAEQRFGSIRISANGGHHVYFRDGDKRKPVFVVYIDVNEKKFEEGLKSIDCFDARFVFRPDPDKPK